MTKPALLGDSDPSESVTTAPLSADTYTWEFCRSCGGAGWVGARIDHEHPSCGHGCTLCYPPPGYDRTYAVGGRPDG